MSLRFDKWKRLSFVMSAAVILTGIASFAQNNSSDDSKRKVKSRAPLVRPDLAKQANINGKAKVEAVIAPAGHVKSTRVVGGSPVLAQACQDSVKDWKFYPGPDDSTQIIECDFQSGQ